MIYRNVIAPICLPVDHYQVHMPCAPMPSYASLKKEFGEHNVTSVFDGRPFKLHPSCVGMSRIPGDRIFLVQNVGRNWESEERIAWGHAQRTVIAPKGYRPAIHNEVYGFQKDRRELIDLVALGSFAMDDVGRRVAVIWNPVGQRVLDSFEFRHEWFAIWRVLFVVNE